MTKDDKQFLEHARKSLGMDYDYVIDEARKVYQSHQRPSIAKREANLVVLNALKEIGEEHWRPDKEKKDDAPRIEVKPSALPPSKQGERKWKGKSILEMADEKLKK